MDDLFQKYKETLIKNEELCIELKKQETQIKLLQEELKYTKLSQNISEGKENIENESNNKKGIIEENINLKQEIQAIKNKNIEIEQRFRDFYVENRKYILGLLGYQMEITDNQIELLSLYAFDKSDVFLFQKCDDSLELLSNDFAEGYGKEINDYIMTGRSIPAFLAAVTLDLWNKKTMQ